MEILKIEQITPNPENPRKDLGDLTELVDSVKENGILQPITAVKEGATYKIIIGHRRFAAAKQAGLTELTVNVVEMDDKQQLSTMLLENMQRKDLTPVEEARGFQMCLDLGVSEDELKQRTGLSKKKIKHRINILKMDQKKVEETCGSIEDYIALEEIKDIEERTKLLDFLGTDDFNMELLKAKEKQEKVNSEKQVQKNDLTDDFDIDEQKIDEPKIEKENVETKDDEIKAKLKLMKTLRIDFMKKVFKRKIEKEEFAKTTAFFNERSFTTSFNMKGDKNVFFDIAAAGTAEDMQKHITNYFVVTVYALVEKKDPIVYEFLKIFNYKMSNDEKLFVNGALS